VGDVRQEGLLLAIELVQDRETREPFSADKHLAYQIYREAEKLGVIGRGLGNTLFLVPPFCSTDEQLTLMVGALYEALFRVLPI
jgi:adenosylmethionine-8-amino-7-oxononanoate aminotransferase